MEGKYEFLVEIVYEDGSGFNFNVTIEGREGSVLAELSMITRGTLRASSGHRATAYNKDGIDVVSYVR